MIESRFRHRDRFEYENQYRSTEDQYGCPGEQALMLAPGLRLGLVSGRRIAQDTVPRRRQSIALIEKSAASS